jgi:hypothetical protein
VDNDEMESKFSQFLKRVADTRDDEINCSACLEQIDQYVELELTTAEPARALPLVAHHLAQCKVCHEEYQLLRELALFEARGEQPDNEELAHRLTQEHEPRE